jgi:hypothetical protein
MATLERPILRPNKRARERVFFGGMTLLMIGTILLGFRATYFPLGPKPEAIHSFPSLPLGAGGVDIGAPG